MTYHHAKESESLNDFSEECHGKQVRIWVVAHCVIKDGVIVEEFLVRDNKRLFRQLGMCSESVAKNWAKRWLSDKRDPARSGSCHLTWLAAEFQRVQGIREPGQVPKINLDNVAPAERHMNEYLALRIAGLFGQVWGPQGMTSRDKFESLVKQLYHPHARFESPQTNDIDLTGWAELVTLYDSFVLGNQQGKQVAISLDWVIVQPGHETRKFPNCGKTNEWRYPTATDKDLQLQLNEKFNNSDQLSLSYTLAIRWTLVGFQKQSDGEVLAPVVLLAESHLECAGFRVLHDITVYDGVAVDAQIHLAHDAVHED